MTSKILCKLLENTVLNNKFLSLYPQLYLLGGIYIKITPFFNIRINSAIEPLKDSKSETSNTGMVPPFICFYLLMEIFFFFIFHSCFLKSI